MQKWSVQPVSETSAAPSGRRPWRRTAQIALAAAFAGAHLAGCGQSDTDAKADVAVDDGVDVGSDDLTAADVASADVDSATDSGGLADTGPSCPGDPGCPCAAPADCDNNLCIDTPEGTVCATTCVDSCPNESAQACAAVPQAGGDVIQMCVPRFGMYCDPCSSKADCPLFTTSGEPACARHVSTAGQLTGGYCSVACSEDSECPPGSACLDTPTLDGAPRKLCRPGTAAAPAQCLCSERAAAKQLGTVCEASSAAGICPGTATCAKAGAPAACSAKAAVAETCDGVDNDCNGTTDEGLCDDKDACTVDTCDGAKGTCGHVPSDGPCDDGNACTNGDSCGAGKCQGTLLICDDGNPCTDDSCAAATGCVQTPTKKVCDDANACTDNDLCNGAGACVGLPLTVTIACDDGNPCTADSCEKTKGCVHTPAAAPCDDGNPCTNGDTCQAGACQSGTNLCSCTEDVACAGKEDGNLCNGTLFCDKSAPPFACVIDAKTVVTCDGSGDTACAVNTCSPATGKCAMVPASDGKACDADGSVCSVGDLCEAGACKPGKALDCNDNNPCTDDACDAKLGCKPVFNIGACEDGDACTTGDTCALGKCVSGPKLACDDGSPCTKDACDKIKGVCVYDGAPYEGDPCDADNSVCTKADTCQGGACKPGKVLVCDDQDLCTDDSCDPASGCKYLNNAAPCDADGNPCTLGDACQNGACAKGPAKDCNDNNPCTVDACVKSSGACAHDGKAQEGAPCDADGTVCTEADACAEGVCKAGASKVCDDANSCTSDSCHPKAGCQVTATDGKPCDDGEACSKSDVCAGGKCKGLPLSCNDDNPCTDDVCAADAGCKYPAVADGTPCATAQHCVAAKCVTPACGDGYKAAGEACDDGNTSACDGCESCVVRAQLALDGKGDASRAAASPGADGVVPPLALRGDLTIAAWVRLDALGKDVVVVSRGAANSATIPWLLGVTASAVPYFQHGGAAGKETVLADNAGKPWALAKGVWAHLAVVVTGSKVRLYVDGKPAGASTLLLGRADAPAASVVVGARVPGDSASGFVGRIDEVHLAAGALYGGAFVPGRHAQPDATTVALWRMDSASGGKVVKDDGPFGYDLALAGGAALAPDDCYGRDASAAVCGDGKIASGLEECDDGAAKACDGCEGCRKLQHLTVGAKGVLVTPAFPSWAADAVCATCQATIEAWVRPDKTAGVFEIAATSCGYAALVLAQNPSGGTNFGIVRFPLPPVFGTTIVKPGKWYHVAASFGWDAGDPIRIFVDGKLEGETTAQMAATMPGAPIDKELLFVGAGVQGGNGACVYQNVTPSAGPGFPGAVDEVRLSAGLRYGDTFVPRRRSLPDADTRGLWRFDGAALDDSDGGQTLQVAKADVTAAADACYGEPSAAATCGDGQAARWEGCDSGSQNGPWPAKCDRTCVATSEPDCSSLGWQAGTVPLGKNTMIYDAKGWTVEGWVRLPALPVAGFGVVAGVDEPITGGCPSMPAQGGWRIAVAAGGEDASKLGGSNEKAEGKGAVWQAGVWHHVALQFEGAGKGSLWLDGRRVKRFANAASTWSASCPLKLGDAMQGSGAHKLGAEVASLRLSRGVRYGQGFVPRRTIDADKAAVWLFEFGDGSGSVALDLVTGYKLEASNLAWSKAKGPACQP